MTLEEMKKEQGFIQVGDVWIETQNRFQAEGVVECFITGKVVYQEKKKK